MNVANRGVTTRSRIRGLHRRSIRSAAMPMPLAVLDRTALIVEATTQQLGAWVSSLPPPTWRFSS